MEIKKPGTDIVLYEPPQVLDQGHGPKTPPNNEFIDVDAHEIPADEPHQDTEHGPQTEEAFLRMMALGLSYLAFSQMERDEQEAKQKKAAEDEPIIVGPITNDDEPTVSIPQPARHLRVERQTEGAKRRQEANILREVADDVVARHRDIIAAPDEAAKAARKLSDMRGITSPDESRSQSEIWKELAQAVLEHRLPANWARPTSRKELRFQSTLRLLERKRLNAELEQHDLVASYGLGPGASGPFYRLGEASTGLEHRESYIGTPENANRLESGRYTQDQLSRERSAETRYLKLVKREQELRSRIESLGATGPRSGIMARLAKFKKR